MRSTPPKFCTAAESFRPQKTTNNIRPARPLAPCLSRLLSFFAPSTHRTFVGFLARRRREQRSSAKATFSSSASVGSLLAASSSSRYLRPVAPTHAIRQKQSKHHKQTDCLSGHCCACAENPPPVWRRASRTVRWACEAGESFPFSLRGACNIGTSVSGCVRGTSWRGRRWFSRCFQIATKGDGVIDELGKCALSFNSY